MSGLLEWIQDYAWLLWTLAGVSVGSIILAILLAPRVVRRLPVNYFIRPASAPREPVGLGRTIVRNVLGWFLVVAGVIMCFIPGQGLLTIVIGLTMVDFPGRKRCERMLFHKIGPLRMALNWMRKRGGEDPFAEEAGLASKGDHGAER